MKNLAVLLLLILLASYPLLYAMSLFRKLSFQTRIAAFFILTAIILAGIFCAIAINNLYSIRTAKSVEHAQILLLHTEKVRTEIDEIQSDARAYIITGQDKYLDLYASSDSVMSNSLVQIRALTEAYPVQRANVGSLTTIVRQIVQLRKQFIDVRKSGGFEEAKQLFTTTGAEDLSNNARKIIGSLQQEENKLLLESKAANIKSINNSSIIISIFIIITVFLLISAFFVISKNTRLRTRAEEEIKKINASLVQTVEEKTREVIEQKFELADQQLQQQKLLTAIAIGAQERERDELGKELHDNINQILTSVKLCLEMAKNDRKYSDELIARAYESINKAIHEIRNLSHSLVAPSLGETSFSNVMEKLAQEASLVNGLRVEFVNQSGMEICLGKDKELMLYRIAQEQINNIRKYSMAKNALLTLNRNGKNVVLSISDNGVGFDPAKKANGIGLKNVKSRVEFYSGKMNLVSAPGAGCRLEASVPV
jgi:signal transduction histidine kinase